MTTATPAEYGAAYLDEHHPGWANLIDLSRFDMGDPCECVLGQVFTRPSSAKHGYYQFHDKHGDLVYRLGFEIPESTDAFSVTHSYAGLTAEWSQLISQRQAQPIRPSTPQEVAA